MNAKDTLKKIAEALNIVSEDAKEVVSDAIDSTQEVIEDVAEAVLDTVEDVVEVAEDVKEAVSDVIDDVKEAVSDVVENIGEAVEDAGEAIQDAAEAISPTPQDERVGELEKQLADLKEILKNAMTQEEAPQVEAPEPKGLTHSPEKQVAKKAASGVGRKGNSIQERVNRYINNN
tara:strand:- start:36 stop:560 length:525 start_codon:yes stop_codon:yes gene_type:complete